LRGRVPRGGGAGVRWMVAGSVLPGPAVTA
jgi:hypothetical protein